jgi:hypothetical protein
MTDDRGSKWSILSENSILSIGSKGSILSIGSAGSILSVGSAGSFLSLGSAAWRSSGTVLGRASQAGPGEPALPGRSRCE